MVVQRTGWGKSLVYFLATRLLRARGAGPTILVSPLLSLMRDQLRAADRLELTARRMDSTTYDKYDEIEELLRADELDLLFVSPERLGTERFQTQTVPAIAAGIGMLVVDEAHCISDWGHDFRPDYRRIDRLVQQLPPRVPLLATTATANDRVQADVEDQLGPDLEVIRGPLARDSLHLQVVRLEHQAERLAWLADYLRDAPGSGVVYTLTQRDAERVSRWLAARGIEAPAYHAAIGGGDPAARPVLEERLRRNEVKALVATVALGMGFDKPDLGFVVHFQRPGSVIFYYQQIGRAGRAVDRAEVVLLTGGEDEQITTWFINSAFPPEEDLREVLTAIEAVDDVSTTELAGEVNLTQSSIARALKFLELEGAIVKTGARWSRTINPWAYDAERGSRVAHVRHREQLRMREYAETSGCLMEFLTRSSTTRGPAHASGARTARFRSRPRRRIRTSCVRRRSSCGGRTARSPRAGCGRRGWESPAARSPTACSCARVAR